MSLFGFLQDPKDESEEDPSAGRLMEEQYATREPKFYRMELKRKAQLMRLKQMLAESGYGDLSRMVKLRPENIDIEDY